MKAERRMEAEEAAQGARAPIILVADDEPVNLALIKRRLEWEDYRVHVTPYEIENFLPIL